MSNNDIKKYIENIIGTTNQKSNTPSVTLFKLFLTSFILLLIYLIYNSFFGKNSTVVKGNGLNVIGFYFGSVDKNSDKNLIINLGPENKIQTGVAETKQLDTQKATEQSKPNKIEIAKTFKIGAEFSDITSQIGKPDRKLEVTSNQKQSGFAMYVWDTKPRIFMTFYKNNLVSKITQ